MKAMLFFKKNYLHYILIILRFLRVKGDAIQDFKAVFELMEEKEVGLRCSMIYEAYAISLVAGGRLMEANKIYELAIERFWQFSFLS